MVLSSKIVFFNLFFVINKKNLFFVKYRLAKINDQFMSTESLYDEVVAKKIKFNKSNFVFMVRSFTIVCSKIIRILT